MSDADSSVIEPPNQFPESRVNEKQSVLVASITSQMEIETDKIDKGKLANMVAKLRMRNLDLGKELSDTQKENGELEKKLEKESNYNQKLKKENEILEEKVSDFEMNQLSDKILIAKLKDDLTQLRSEKN